jgi:hypothetical protein
MQLYVITSVKNQADYINQMITIINSTTYSYYFINSYLRLGRFDYFNQTIALSVITLCTFHYTISIQSNELKIE